MNRKIKQVQVRKDLFDFFIENCEFVILIL